MRVLEWRQDTLARVQDVHKERQRCVAQVLLHLVCPVTHIWVVSENILTSLGLFSKTVATQPMYGSKASGHRLSTDCLSSEVLKGATAHGICTAAFCT